MTGSHFAVSLTQHIVIYTSFQRRKAHSLLLYCSIALHQGHREGATWEHLVHASEDFVLVVAGKKTNHRSAQVAEFMAVTFHDMYTTLTTHIIHLA